MSGAAASGAPSRRSFCFDLDDERLARIAWSRLSEPGDARASSLVQKVGPGDALRALVERDVDWLARYRPRLVDLDPERDLDALAALNGRVVLPHDQEWPTGVDDLEVPPICLWVRGPARLDRVGRRSVAVVGARAASAYGERVATELAYGLVHRGFTVLSGLAYGIDAAAHRGALAAAADVSTDGGAAVGPEGPPALTAWPGLAVEPALGPDPGRSGPVSVGVVAGGIDRAYPRGNEAVMTMLATTGAVVSEVPPGSNPSRSRFLQRNRLIAAIAGGTVVVEAALRSGSLNTARTASGLGRPVGAVPGPVTSMTSAGCHGLVRSGAAVLVTDAGEVADLVGAIGTDLHAPARCPDRPLDGLEPWTLRVHDALSVRSARPVDQVCRGAGLDEDTVRIALGQLSLLGLAHRDGTGWRAIRPSS